MKSLNSYSDFLAIQNLLNELIANHTELVVWQVATGDDRRRVGTCYLQEMRDESLQFSFSDEIELKYGGPLYYYAEEGQFIFKSRLIENKGHFFDVAFPIEIKLLDDPEATIVKGEIGFDLHEFWRLQKIKKMEERTPRDVDMLTSEFSLSLDDEDKLYADKRASPRSRPQGNKWVKLRIAADPFVHRLKLFDLSRGGMGILCGGADVLPKGSEVHIIGFDEFDLDDPLVGDVMSQRPVDKSEKEFKVGIKFREGQS